MARLPLISFKTWRAACTGGRTLAHHPLLATDNWLLASGYSPRAPSHANCGSGGTPISHA